MIQEVLYSEYLDTGKHITSLELETFVRLFVNHRPVYGLTMDLIKDKMTILSKYENNINQENKNNKNTKKNDANKEDEEQKRLDLERYNEGGLDRDFFI